MAVAVFAAARSTLIDDAYIALDYTRSLAFHWHWGLIETNTANSATSALEVMVLAVFTAITRRPVLALGIVYVLSVMAMEFGLRRAARAAKLPGWIGLLTVFLVSVNPLLISSIGLEVALGGGLIALLLAAAGERRPVWFGVLAGLLVLNRPDLIIVVLAVFLFRPGWWHGWWRSLLAAVAVAGPWYLWSWLVLGSAVPDTLFIKVDQHSWGSYTFGNGPKLYLIVYPTATVLSFLPAALGALAALCWLGLRLFRPTERVRRLGLLAALPVAGGLHYLAYSDLGVPPYHWYYGPSIICLTTFLAAAVGAAWSPSGARVRARWTGFASLTVVVALLAASAASYGAGLPSEFSPITTNWASPAQYAEIGTELHRLVGDSTVQSPGEIGALAYFCDCAMVDEFSDRGNVVNIIGPMAANASTIKRMLMNWNFRFLDRAQRPVVPTFVLAYAQTVPKDAIRSWPVDSPWAGRHFLVLSRNPTRD